jgi:3-hydroxyisobutyrate dehydrogenase-like beta-hydroxyacid dehydrogenase
VSTVLPDTVEDLAGRARAVRVDVVDTPVAGRGMMSVEEGTVQVLVGDEGPLLARLEPILRRFAGRVVPAGGLGSGAALKLAHNVIVYAGFAATIEAIELARAAGVRTGLVEDVARTSGALGDLAAFAMPFYRHARDDPHGPGEDEMLRGAAELLEKDLADAVDLGRHHGVDLPVARLLRHSGATIFPFDPDADESHRDPTKSAAEWLDDVLRE